MHGQRRELLRRAALIQAPELARELAAADGTAGRVVGEGREPSRQLVEGEAQLQERAPLHLNGDLLLRQAAELHGVHAAGQEFVLHLARQRDEFAQMPGACDEHRRHQVLLAHGEDRRRLDFRRQAAQLRHPLLHGVHRGLHMGVRLQFDPHEGEPIAGDAPHRLHFRDGLDVLFHGGGHQLLDVLRAGAAPSDAGVHELPGAFGVEPHRDLRHRPHAGEDHQHHRQVRGEPMLHEDADEVHGRLPDIASRVCINRAKWLSVWSCWD